MESHQFIRRELSAFIKKFPNTRVRYQYDDLSYTHFVEVLPKDVYQEDEDYLRWEDEVFRRFIESFPGENVCFISVGDLVSIENPELTLYGSDYTPFTSKSEQESLLFTVVLNNNIKNICVNAYSSEQPSRSTFSQTEVSSAIIDEIKIAA